MNSKENTLECVICLKEFTCSPMLTSHKQIHSEEKKCSSCQKLFKTLTLTVHERIHSAEKHFNVPYVKRHLPHLVIYMHINKGILGNNHSNALCVRNYLKQILN